MSINISIDPVSMIDPEAAAFEGVNVIVSFGDGTAFRYFNIDIVTASQLVANPGLYNSYLRGNTNSERIA